MTDCKSVLVKNSTQECQATLFVYSRHDPLCWMSSSSKIVPPGTSYLYRYENDFKFEITGIFNKKKKISLVNVRKWIKDTHIAILDSETVKESDLQHHEQEKTICIRKLNVEKEVSLDNGRNLYEILKLNFEVIKTLDKDKQDKEIRKAFHKEIRRWHPDRAGEHGDDEMAREVIIAYDILANREKRAEYHNKANYSKGWLSTSRWKSIFWSEYETKEQKRNYRKRLAMMALSFGVGVGGLALNLLTAGAAAPVVVGLCGTLGTGCIGGGVQSLIRTVSRQSIEKGCDMKDYAKTFGLGFVAGAVTGGAGVGISAGIAGIGSAATPISATTVTEFIGIGANTAAIGGTTCSLARDFERKIVDGDEVTGMQFVGHALVGAVIGAATGSAVGAVSGAVANLSAEISSTNIEGRLVPGMRRYGVLLAKGLSKGVTNKSTECVLGSVTRYVEERLDDDLENRPVSEHILDSGTKILTSVVSEFAVGVISTAGEHAFNERTVHNRLYKDDSSDINIVHKSSNADILDRNANSNKFSSLNDLNRFESKDLSLESFDTSPNSLLTEQERRQRIRCNLDQESHSKWYSNNVKAQYNPPEHEIKHEKVTHPNYYVPDTCITVARFILVSKGHWLSRMVVEYTENKGTHQKKETTSGVALEIPTDAKNIKVYFQVMRFISVWCDVKKWNRFEKKWYDEPHIFKYEQTPEQRRFTVDGPLYFEGVIHVTDEKHDDVNEM